MEKQLRLRKTSLKEKYNIDKDNLTKALQGIRNESVVTEKNN